MSTCHITFQADVSRTWADLCLLTLHEYGHLAGFTDPLNPADPYHSHDPASFMSADLGNGNLVDADYGRVHVFKGYDRRCAYHGRPYLGLSHRGMQREVWR